MLSWDPTRTLLVRGCLRLGASCTNNRRTLTTTTTERASPYISRIRAAAAASRQFTSSTTTKRTTQTAEIYPPVIQGTLPFAAQGVAVGQWAQLERSFSVDDVAEFGEVRFDAAELLCLRGTLFCLIVGRPAGGEWSDVERS